MTRLPSPPILLLQQENTVSKVSIRLSLFIVTMYSSLLDFVSMGKWRKLIIKHKSISWLLVTAILFITFLPAHYHLHHFFSADSTTHAHSVDLHLIADISGDIHHDENATIVEATPDGIVKNNNPAFSPFILIATVLIILSIVYRLIRIQLTFRDTVRKQTPPHFSPPLRAPPLV